MRLSKHTIFILQLAAVGLWLGVAHAAPPEWLQVQAVEIDRTREFYGEVEAVNQATVSAQTTGRVSAIRFDVDDFVPAGSVLLTLTDGEQKEQLRQAQARLDSARAVMRQAEADFARVKDLFERKLIAKSDFDGAQRQRNTAEAEVQAAAAAVSTAQTQLEYTEIRAPYDGIVTERHVEVGETVTPGMPLMSGLSLLQLRVITQIPENLINVVRPDPRAAVILPGGELLAAEQVTVFPRADSATRTFRVRIELPESQTGLYPGMTVKTQFTVGRERVVMVPVTAVVQRGELSVLSVRGENGPLLRQVRLGRRIDDRVIVVAGLSAGEWIAPEALALQ